MISFEGNGLIGEQDRGGIFDDVKPRLVFVDEASRRDFVDLLAKAIENIASV